VGKKLSSRTLENLIKRETKQHGTPLMLIDRGMLESQFRLFQKHLPDVHIYYAVKANPHPEIIKTFAAMGASFDVASANEIKHALRYGATPSRLIFANTIKSPADIKEAKKLNVSMMTFDNEAELYKIAKNYRGAKVVLRIKVANVGSVVELSLKFGADPEDAIYLLRKAKILGLDPVGLSFHVGSQCIDSQNYLRALEVSSAIFNEAEEKGIDLKILDIGGGFPIKHFDNENVPPFEKIASQIRQELRRLFKTRLKQNKIKIIAEPGRFLAGPSGTLITSVVGRAFRNNKNYYYLDDGIYQDFSGIVFDHCKYEFKSMKKGQKFLCTLAGPTCDSFDTISVNEEMPELDVGNMIYVKNIGAYSMASAVQGFNGFQPAKVIFI
jgi:ornithine decarboxylase